MDENLRAKTETRRGEFFRGGCFMFRTSKFWLPTGPTGPEVQQCVVPSVPTVPGWQASASARGIVGLGLVGGFFSTQNFFVVGNMGYPPKV